MPCMIEVFKVLAEILLGTTLEVLARLTRRRRRPIGTTTADPLMLPEEIVSSILSRLPVKTLLRLQLVCKSWRALICDSHFIRCHLMTNHSKQQQPTRILMMTCKDLDPTGEEDVCLCSCYAKGGGEPHRCNFLMQLRLPGDGTLHMHPFSVDGLVLFHSATKIHVCNPSTRKLATLPDGSPHRPLPDVAGITQHVGLGYDASTKKYKVARIFYRSFDARRGVYDAGCEVFDLGSPLGTWRAAADPPLPVSTCRPVVVDGVVYWAVPDAHRKKRAHVVSFDLRSERFGVIDGPDHGCAAAGTWLVRTSVGGGGRNLGVQVWRRTCVEGYKRGGGGAWEKEYSISLERMVNTVPSAVVHGTAVLPLTRRWTGFASASAVRQHDAESCGDVADVCSSHDAEGIRRCEAVVWEESLVPVQ